MDTIETRELKLGVFRRRRWHDRRYKKRVKRSSSNKDQGDSYVPRNGRRNFIHSFVAQVADQKSTLWTAPRLNRVVDQNDGTT